MRVFATIAAMLLALGVVSPAQAQSTGLPIWLVGTWCGELGGGGGGPQLCDKWTVGPDGTLQNRIVRADGDTADWGSSGVISLESGRLVLRGGAEGKPRVDYREVSRGRMDLAFENRMDGQVQKLSLSRVGDDLFEEIWFRGRAEPQRTVYHLKK